MSTFQLPSYNRLEAWEHFKDFGGISPDGNIPPRANFTHRKNPYLCHPLTYIVVTTPGLLVNNKAAVEEPGYTGSPNNKIKEKCPHV